MNMKKLVALLLALVMVFALCACGSKDAKDTDKKDDGKNTKRPKCLHSAGSHLLQRRQLCFQTRRRMFRPDGHTAAQQQLRPLRRALQHRSQ